MPLGSTGASVAGTNTASEIVLSAPVTSQLLAGQSTGCVSHPVSVVVTQASLLSPTKLVSALPTSTTPTKLIFTSKGLGTAVRSPTKIAIPLNTQSPQKLLQSGQFKIVSASTISGATNTAATGGIQPKKLTFSPQKVIIRPQQPGSTGVSRNVTLQIFLYMSIVRNSIFCSVMATDFRNLFVVKCMPANSKLLRTFHFDN